MLILILLHFIANLGYILPVQYIHSPHLKYKRVTDCSSINYIPENSEIQFDECGDGIFGFSGIWDIKTEPSLSDVDVSLRLFKPISHNSILGSNGSHGCELK